MTLRARQEPSQPPGEHLILYDGLCGLCNRLNRFVLSRDKRGLFDFASLQGPVGRSILCALGKASDVLNTFYLVKDYRSGSPELLSKSGAAVTVLQNLGFPWCGLAVLRVFPKTMLDWSYTLIARHRYAVFGKVKNCLVPSSEYRHRFIDHLSCEELFLKASHGQDFAFGNSPGLEHGELSGERRVMR